ncbi:MAG: hypothetical protein ACTSQZ_04840 [Candidatus Thorarchaeota archaeon]
MNECAHGLYEEIDTSGQGKWILPAALVFVIVVGLLIVRLFVYPPGDPPYDDQADLFLIIGIGPVGVCLLGSLFGILRKRATKVNPDRLEFTEDVRKLEDFGKVYHEGDFRTGELGGHPTYMCGWAFIVLIAFAAGLVAVFLMSSIQFYLEPVIHVTLSAILYVAGFSTAFRAIPIGNKLVRNPLNESVAKYLSKYQVLLWITECDLVSDIIVRYKIGKGQTLKVIDDIHVFAVTSTEPMMEIEITTNNIENFGLEYTYYLSEELVPLKEEIIDVVGKKAHLIVNEIDKNKYIQVRYEMGTLRAKFNIRTPESQCNLLHALVDEVSKYRSVAKIPKIENSASDE